MINKIEKSLRNHGLMPKRSVLVGLSGGADSVALLDIMCKLGEKYDFTVCAAHINHGLRGDDAENDEKFSAELCRRMGVECYIMRADVRKAAETDGVSEELAGRRVRYDFFDKIMAEHSIEYTATAHHKNDNAETLLMNFMRGSGIAGLCGIPYKRERYIRPLLDVTREEIEQYCVTNGLEYVTDKTNFENNYTRNKIRNILIPLIRREFNPNFTDTVTANSEIIRSDEEFINSYAAERYDSIVTDDGADIEELNRLHYAVASRIIRRMIENVCGIADISSAVIKGVHDICTKNKTGLYAPITSGVAARTQYGRLIIEREAGECEDFAYTIKIGESMYIPQLGYTVSVQYADCRQNDGGRYFSIPDDVGSIVIRNRRRGDVFNPSGMSGMKKVKDYMINEKIPRDKRSRVGIAEIDGRIAWLVGYRNDGRFNFHDKGIKIYISY